MSNAREYYFLVYIELEKKNDPKQMKFSTENKSLTLLSYKTLSKEEKNKLFLLFKYADVDVGKKKIDIKFKCYDEDYIISFTKEEANFIFIVDFEYDKCKFLGLRNTKIPQDILSKEEIFNYFYEYIINKENNKLDNLYDDSLKIYNKKPDFRFLIHLFISINNTNSKYFTKLFEEFRKQYNKQEIIDDLKKIKAENIRKYQQEFCDIYKKANNLIAGNSLNKIDFYGFILIYLNIVNYEEFKMKLDELYKKQNNILFEILLKYRFYFVNQIELDHLQSNELIKYTLKQSYTEFKYGLFYIREINLFFEIIDNNKEEIAKLHEFKPIEVINFEDENRVDFEKIQENLNNIFEFSNKNNTLLVYFNFNFKKSNKIKKGFWENLKKCPSNTINDIQLFCKLRDKLIHYHNLVNKFYTNKRESILEEINIFINDGNFENEINERVKRYIENNTDKITNTEIINLINLNVYYHDEKYKSKRETNILEKIKLENIDEEFINDFKKVKFEKIFEGDFKKYVTVLIGKIKKIQDFDIILKLININGLNQGNIKTYLIILNK